MNEDAPRTVDPDRLRETSQQVFGALSGAMTAAMIYLGDRLGLYRALAGMPPPHYPGGPPPGPPPQHY